MFFGGHSVYLIVVIITIKVVDVRGTAVAVSPPFRAGKPALCGSHPLVTPY